MTATTTDLTVAKNKPLPKGWRWVKLGEVCRFINGDAYKESDWGPEGVRIIRIQNLNDTSKPFNYWAGRLDNRVQVKDGDLLLAWSGTPGTSFGAHIWNRGPGVLNQHIFLVHTDAALDKAWTREAINHVLEDLIRVAHGAVGLAHVTKREVEALRIPLPPLPEQKRIADILNKQMAAVERARKAAEERLAAVNALPDAAYRELLGSDQIRSWDLKTVADITTLVTDGPHVTPTYIPDGVPFVTVTNIQSGRLAFENISYISVEDHNRYASRAQAEQAIFSTPKMEPSESLV